MNCVVHSSDAEGARVHHFTGEVWLPIPGWEGLYEASNFAQIRSLDRWVQKPRQQPFLWKGRIMQQTLSGGKPGKKYLIVRLCRDGVSVKAYVHHLMFETFHGPRVPGLVVCHRDDDQLNNDPFNLKLDTHGGNADDRVLNGHDHETNKEVCPQCSGQYTLIAKPNGRYKRECVPCRNGLKRERRLLTQVLGLPEFGHGFSVKQLREMAAAL